MALISSGTLNVTATATRGLLYNTAAYAARGGQFAIGVVPVLFAVKVKAGEETPIPVTVNGLPANANVHKITASLMVMSDGSAGLSTPVGVQEGSNPERTFNVNVNNGPGLRNVEVKLQGGTSPIWTQPGPVSAGTYQITDFASQANAYLEQAKLTGATVLQFLVKSDADGSVFININPGFEFTLLQMQSWKNDLDSTFRIDRNLQLEFNSIEELPLDAIAGNISRSAIRLDAGGQFGPDRLLGEVESWDGRQHTTVSADYSVAQRIVLNPDVVKKTIKGSGIVLYLSSEQPADLYVELQSDANGSPAIGVPLAKSNVSYKPPQTGERQQWTLASFDSPADLHLDAAYWVVVKAARGDARLGLVASTAPGPPVLRRGITVNRGGERWKCLVSPRATNSCDSSVAALVGLIYVPDPDNQTAAVQVLVSNSSIEQRLDPSGQPKTAVLNLEGDKRPQATLVVRSHARGMLTLVNVVQEYTLA
jgi:hypothetical protein